MEMSNTPSDTNDIDDRILLERERDEGDKILRERSKNPFISSHFFEVDTKKVTDEGHYVESSTKTTMITSANGRVMENSRDFCHEDDACPVTENNLDDDDEDTLLDSEVVDLREFSLDSKNERLANALKAKGVSVITGGNAHCTYCSKWRKFNKIRWPIIAQYKLLDLILTLLLIFAFFLMTWRFGTYKKTVIAYQRTLMTQMRTISVKIDTMEIEINSSCQQPANTESLASKTASKLTNLTNDTWKFNPCTPNCLHCSNLLTACLRFNATGACSLHATRCDGQQYNPTLRDSLNICEPGCLDCNALRFGCEDNFDSELCLDLEEYCFVNKNNV
eukprot:Seg4081.3 transcript_id=Seg4081.3/GoldUCD/mRNA.D3Y31 product="hypothetical protein" protein_id=Seg4081.3/GoldUCD/D3Y31